MTAVIFVALLFRCRVVVTDCPSATGPIASMVDCIRVKSENSEFWLFAIVSPEESLPKAKTVNFPAPRMASDFIESDRLPDVASVVNVDE
jgi:hypothetical protein